MIGKLALISGGTKGLGRVLSLGLAQNGYRVISLYASDEGFAQTLRADVERMGLLSQVIRCDVGSQQQVLTLFKNCRSWFDESEITLIHNASSSFSPRPFLQIPWEEFQTLHQTNAGGYYNLTQACLPRMLVRKKGTVIDILSGALQASPPKGFASYLCAKGGLQSFSRSLASEYSRLGIRIYSFSPGLMDTPLTQSWDPMMMDLMTRGGVRASPPEEVAERILKIMSNPETQGQGENYAV